MAYAAPSQPPAQLDRRVTGTTSSGDQSAKRISNLKPVDRWLLLGEPGSGKSTTFRLAAQDEQTEAITAKAFVEGARPAGPVVFIDALEEYRIGEAGQDRLPDLMAALKSAGYARWRITCRSVSLPLADLIHIEKALGEFETWHLAQLETAEQRAILGALGETDPDGLLAKVDDLAASALMGNPATLKLLRETLDGAPDKIESRGALFDHATFAMAHEVNPDRAERFDRPTPGAIIAAAEKACLVLMLSARADLWTLGVWPPRDGLVTRDDLIPAGIDMVALAYAIDTPMFRGEAGSYGPTHRMVAEYLAGRALAKLASGVDGKTPALPLERAFALLCGDDDQPAPALIGTFAWFVTGLANGLHCDRALDLVRQHPEAILFQGDAAMLPPRHRQALLDATGSGDPWFFTGLNGSTAIGGLAGDDLRHSFRTILGDADETAHRKAMVIAALGSGPRVPALDADVINLALTPSLPGWVRRNALDTIYARFPAPLATMRKVVAGMKSEALSTAMTVKPKALSYLVGHGATDAEIRKALVDYARTGDGVSGYAQPLGSALEAAPPPALFDKPLSSRKALGQSRSYEAANIIQRVLARAIDDNPALTARDLLRWLANADLKDRHDPEDHIRQAVRGWIGRAPDNSSELFWALYDQSHGEGWRPLYNYHRLAGVDPDRKVFQETLMRLARARAAPDAPGLARVAMDLLGPIGDPDKRYWRIWRLLANRPETSEMFEALTRMPIDHWRGKSFRRDRANASEAPSPAEKDIAWLKDNIDAVRAGTAFSALRFAAEVFVGHYKDRAQGEGVERLLSWVGPDLTDALVQGWKTFVDAFPFTWRQQANQNLKNFNYHANQVAAVFVDHALRFSAAPPDLTLNAAFGVLRGYYMLDSDARDGVRRVAVDRISGDDEGRKALQGYWKVAIKANLSELPDVNAFEEAGEAGWAVSTLLRANPDLPSPLLRSALALAGRTMSFDDIHGLIEAALRKSLSTEARTLWVFVAFLTDPERHRHAFTAELSTSDAHALFDRLNRGHLIYGYDRLTKSETARDLAIAKHLGAVYRPGTGSPGDRDDMSQVVAGALAKLAASPTAAATEALRELVNDPGLEMWRDLLRHHQAKQTLARRHTEFTAPAPKKVAEAIAAGPPATPADLRAVVRETLVHLAEDIRNGDTQGWKGFWNNPDDAAERRPKVENDCRDLITDRLRDRLMRYGLGANRAFTEARRRHDRRVDLLVIGDGFAALPIEAKRHFHRDVWTAAETQLVDYGRSPGTSGHGIYLIFWFGLDAGAVPATTKGQAGPSSAAELRAALLGHQPEELASLIDVIVIDVSPAPSSSRIALKRRTRAAASVTTDGAAKSARHSPSTGSPTS